jgi:hypothetical protein
VADQRGERFTSFVAGLHDRQVTTEHGGRSFGMHINLVPPAAHVLFKLPLHVLAHDQSHLIKEFRDVTGKTPETLFQDTARSAA